MSVTSDQLRLYMSLFRGRSDVFAQHWHDEATGKSGYAPARRRNPDGSAEFLPMTEQVLRWHLGGQMTLGVYPLLPDNTTHFLAVDFDAKSAGKQGNWRLHAVKFLKTCKQHGVPANLERSRSGQGGHVWLFFEEPVAAWKARRVALSLYKLSGAAQSKSLKTLDRFFPNQDRLSGAGLGNLVALPLQGQCVQEGNSVFLDWEGYGEPFEDQWRFLSAVARITSQQLHAIAEELGVLQRLQSVTPFLDSDKPTEIIPVIISGELSIPQLALPQTLKDSLRHTLVFHNPSFYERQAKGLSTYRTPRFIHCWRRDEDFVYVPRGLIDRIRTFCRERNLTLNEIDERVEDSCSAFCLNTPLRSHQQVAVEEILRRETGILLAPPGAGKTLIALSAASQRQQQTLILVHTRQLLSQWIETIVSRTDIPECEIGILSANKWQVGDRLTLGSFQTLARRDLKEVARQFGVLIIDECHRVPAKTFVRVVRQLPARFVLGLTATPQRADGLERLIYFHLGDLIHRVAPVEVVPEPLPEPTIVIRQTHFDCDEAVAEHFQRLGAALVVDENRNRLIAADVIAETTANHTCLVLTDRRIHCEQMARLIGEGVDCRIVYGTMSPSERHAVIEEIASGQTKVLIATSRLVGEGFDCPGLSCLFLAFPLSAPSRLIQYVGRLQRPHAGKVEIKVFDYHDTQVPILDAMFRKRERLYRRMNRETKARQRERAQLKFEF
ncbi:MAG: DEAD/DEAH box helicase family protein [Armatimonadetes bacterium]|nr:DEAD/DEAH box helicase family protein [Armatimonadota bacterium]